MVAALGQARVSLLSSELNTSPIGPPLPEGNLPSRSNPLPPTRAPPRTTWLATSLRSIAGLREATVENKSTSTTSMSAPDMGLNNPESPALGISLPPGLVGLYNPEFPGLPTLGNSLISAGGNGSKEEGWGASRGWSPSSSSCFISPWGPGLLP